MPTANKANKASLTNHVHAKIHLQRSSQRGVLTAHSYGFTQEKSARICIRVLQEAWVGMTYEYSLGGDPMLHGTLSVGDCR